MSRPPVTETKDQRRLGFPFRSGRISLDFVATVAKRDMNDREMITDGESLQTWLWVSGLPAAKDPIDESAVERARVLREAINRLTRARVDETRPVPTDVEILNEAAQRGVPFPKLDYDGLSVHPSAPVPVDQVLAIVARDAVELFSGKYHDRIRRCLGHDCSLYFVDRSRQGVRRWCSMAACGEKASSATYRKRHSGPA
ncbi:ABATE domain-containing protein [Rhodococcus sp. Eu-32]|uniref:CGNR zinc finger domain-containing protein n=1 Tax=Rhodococcus sp. Eu-32 TaxID=1017319 RepID=UPI001401FF72|nr:ABATE domain-containing protein [Rhodococcus sp. Eu-32]